MSHGDALSASVIVPTYNRSALLRRTLASLERQRAGTAPFEVVVADDGSSDDSRSVVAEFAERLEVRYVFQEDQGYRAAAARNAGARVARGDALIFLDSGTLAGPDFVTAHLRALASGSATATARTAVIGYAYGYNPWDIAPGEEPDLGDDDPETIVARLGADRGFRDMREPILERIGDDPRKLHVPWMLFWTMNVSVMAEDFRAVGGFDEDFRSWGCEDVELGYRLSRAGVGLVVSRDAWAIESPHDRDVPGIKASHLCNAMLFWSKHLDPTTEMYWAIYGNGTYDPSLEEVYGDYLRWKESSASLRVTDEVRRTVDGRAAEGSRVLVVGADRAFDPPFAALQWTALCADDEVGEGRADVTINRALGLRTAHPDDSFDLVVLTSRLAGLWPLWGKHLLIEAERVGKSVMLTERLRDTLAPIRSTPLVSAAELSALLESATPPTVLDVRWAHGSTDGEAEYEAGHIPSARYVDLDSELCGPADESGRRPIPDADVFAATMRRHGVCSAASVVVYDGADSVGAARAWWLLRYFGHEDVRVLDGGFAAWRAAAGSSATGPAADIAPGDFTAAPGNMPVLDADGAADIAAAGILLDARPADRYAGRAKPGDGAGGHIPGAISAPTLDYLDPAGGFTSPDRLRSRLIRLGAAERPVGAYCGSGINAAHTVLALEAAGIAASLYPGSWSHWSADPARPIATGPDPHGAS